MRSPISASPERRSTLPACARTRLATCFSIAARVVVARPLQLWWPAKTCSSSDKQLMRYMRCAEGSPFGFPSTLSHNTGSSDCYALAISIVYELSSLF